MTTYTIEQINENHKNLAKKYAPKVQVKAPVIQAMYFDENGQRIIEQAKEVVEKTQVTQVRTQFKNAHGQTITSTTHAYNEDEIM